MMDGVTGGSGKHADAVDGGGTRTNAFRAAANIIQTRWLFRKALIAYADRKIVILGWLHLVASLTIYAHFGFIKFHQQKEKVPEGAPFYWWKVIVPTLEFGAMHTILFQLAVIPLTMCRLTIVKASTSIFNKLIPFNRLLEAHYVVGYAIVILLFLSTMLFLTFFGIICNSGDQAFCSKFTSEIMITGYVLFAAFMAVGVTSYLRHSIPYRLFYVMHHIVFAAYILTIMHTIDNIQRKQGGRSQAFKWFSASILYYATDRAAMYLNHRHKSNLATSTTITSINGKKMILLQVRKPDIFHFVPGQYVHLKIPQIGQMTWKPFSIASSPDSDLLDFYIEVQKEGSWTYKLMELIESDEKYLVEIGKIVPTGLGRITSYDFDSPKGSFDIARSASVTSENAFFTSHNGINVEILGPYGTGLGDITQYSHGLLLGAGTGIVPVLSLFKQHINQMLRLDPITYSKALKQHHQLVSTLNKSHAETKGSIFKRMFSKREKDNKRLSTIMSDLDDFVNSPTEVTNIRKMSLAAQSEVTWYLTVMFGPILGATMLATTLSWNNIPITIYPDMVLFLQIGTISFQALFIIMSLIIQERNSFGLLADVVIGLISILTDWYWFKRNKWGDFEGQDMIYYGIIIGYMFLRLWYSATNPNNPVQKSNERRLLVNLDKVHLVWITRSSGLVSQVYPDILKLWDTLVDKWGYAKAKEVCEICIYITDKNKDNKEALDEEIRNTSLYKQGSIKYCRPELKNVMEKEAEERILSGNASNTLLAFCGSKKMSKDVKTAKILQDISLHITGNSINEVDLVIESYGGYRKTEADSDDSDTLSSNLSKCDVASSESDKFHLQDTNHPDQEQSIRIIPSIDSEPRSIRQVNSGSSRVIRTYGSGSVCCGSLAGINPSASEDLSNAIPMTSSRSLTRIHNSPSNDLQRHGQGENDQRFPDSFSQKSERSKSSRRVRVHGNGLTVEGGTNSLDIL